ncbi:hypothetical protein [Coralliovum pocilloporae]|uniref:hypothetical protein n=1 Tax=Coralliovum pocilloporae TaxID=3066369 RepID=UPI0033070B99
MTSKTLHGTCRYHPIPASTKWAFTTRRVNRADLFGVTTAFETATPGDLMLGQVTAIGQHKRIQLSSGRYSESYIGDIAVMVVGDRYAPDQFEGFAQIDETGADMIAAGGIVGKAVASHGMMERPTRLKPLGLLTNENGDVINISSYGLMPREIPDDVYVFGVFGTSMNAGKTTTAASFAHGLKRAGYQVAGVKATGTGAFGDYNAFLDAGVPALDFTDAGMPTTYKMPMKRIEEGFRTLVGAAADRGAQMVVVEIADGVFQNETASILKGSSIIDRMNAVLFAAPDALSAAGGVETLRKHGLTPLAVSGTVTNSPLALREAEAATGVPFMSKNDLRDPRLVREMVESCLPGSTERLARAA